MHNEKYRIRILYDVPGWAYYWRALALQKYAPDDFIVTIGPNYGAAFKANKHDMVLQLAYSYCRDLRSHLKRGKYKMPLVTSYNVGWNYANSWLDDALKYANHAIINNYEMWDKYGRHPRTHHISNGVDLTTFKVTRPIAKRRHKIIWVGSICHKKTKNYDTILLPLEKELKRRKIPVEFRLTNSMGGKTRLTHPQLCKWYNDATIYVVASKTEGTPNPALEASACGCVVVSTKVGNMPELIKHKHNGYLVKTNMKHILDAINHAMKNYNKLVENNLKEIQNWDWKIRSSEYFDLFRKIIEGRK